MRSSLQERPFSDQFDDFEDIGPGERVVFHTQPVRQSEVSDGRSAFTHCDRREHGFVGWMSLGEILAVERDVTVDPSICAVHVRVWRAEDMQTHLIR